MATYIVTSINFSNDSVASTQTGTLEYKLWSASNDDYILVNASVSVNTDGTLVSPQNITGLVSGETYNVKFSNNCSSPASYWVTTIIAP